MTRIKLLAAIFLNVAVTAATATNFSAKTTKYGSYVHVPAGEVVKGGLLATGAAVVVDGEIQGDLMAFGAHVVVNGTVRGDVLACGADVHLPGVVTGDTQCYGATVETRGQIGGSLNTSAAAVTAGGSVEGDTEINAAAVWLSGSFARGVKAEADYLALEPTAVLAGDLNYRADKLERAPEAKVAGQVKVLPRPVKKARERRFNLGWWLIKNVWVILALFVVAAFLSWLAPSLLPAAADQIKKKPWPTLGVGVAIFAGIPVAVLILIVSLVGIPSALIIAAGYVIALYTARIFAGVFLGKMITERIFRGKDIPPLFAALVGIIILVLAGNIPVFKVILALVVNGLAFGALAFYVWRRRRVAG